MSAPRSRDDNAASPNSRPTHFSLGARVGVSYDPGSGFSPPTQDQPFYGRRAASDSSRNPATVAMTPGRHVSARPAEARVLEHVRAPEANYSSEQRVSPQQIVPSQPARGPRDHGAKVAQLAAEPTRHVTPDSQPSEISKDSASRASQRLTLDEHEPGSIGAARAQTPPPDITESYERTVISISSESEDELLSSSDGDSDNDSSSDRPLHQGRAPQADGSGKAPCGVMPLDTSSELRHAPERQESSLQAERPASTPEPGDPLPITAKSPQSPDSGPLIIDHRYQRDVDWDKKCDRCRDEGFRCYTAQNSTTLAKSCFLCKEGHKICAIEGMRTYKGRSADADTSYKTPKQGGTTKRLSKQMQKKRTSTRLAEKKPDASSSRAALRASPEPPTTRSSKRLKREIRGRTRRHALSPTARTASEEDSDANDAQPKARKRRPNGTFRPLSGSDEELNRCLSLISMHENEK
ncbi:uncharacterized protein PAN0_001d0878 [Moesziomyces antarcticus]|uniref:Uncharacterized protein n=1 Tax=Pseudozyma antarctica TaxID=84753 RepID=A0A5C3FIH9_PSEA2|nr:uncharacterized protein PAN0_001d0878 [Moesziomyces antarcticus]GAK62677.1 hypothetical protein PAN0_001d0878 [Moesziomyces antarcticus]SPO43239.1 uncharacterized protein PSANT_00923 [Moesziomyces antarcticus]